jgi:hypothetical protein
LRRGCVSLVMDPELATLPRTPRPADDGRTLAAKPGGPSDEEILASLASRGERPEDPPWPGDQPKMLFLTRSRFGVSLEEAADANHIPRHEALIAWEYVRERARMLCGEPPESP